MAAKKNRQAVPDGMGWLESASDELIQAMRERADYVKIGSGQLYARTGDSPGGLVGIVSGRVDLHLSKARVSRTLVHTFGPGWWVGDFSAISGKPRLLDHVTALPTELIRIRESELKRIGLEHPDLWRRLARMTTANTELAVSIATRNRLSSPTSNVAATLLEINSTGPGWGGVLPVSQTDLSSIVNMSRRRIISSLEELEHLGSIERGYRTVKILNQASLENAVV